MSSPIFDLFKGDSPVLERRSYNKFGYAVLFIWVFIGVTMFSVLKEETSDPSLSCDVKDELSNSSIEEECFRMYKDRFENRFPLHWFVLVNFSSVLIICIAYSLFMNSRVKKLSPRPNPEELTRNPTPQDDKVKDERTPLVGHNRKEQQLFVAYCLQLVVRFILIIVLIVIQTQVNFYLEYTCKLSVKQFTGLKLNGKFSTTNLTGSYECHNQRVSIGVHALYAINAVFALLILIEICHLQRRANKNDDFMKDSEFYRVHLLEYNLDSDLNSLKKKYLQDTKEVSSSVFKQSSKYLPFDEVYTNVVIHKGRTENKLGGSRRENLSEYLKQADNSSPKQPQDFIDVGDNHVLIVGRAGIGKTWFCEKLLRDWASGKCFAKKKGNRKEEKSFDVAFLVRFKNLNEVSSLTLRELLTNRLQYRKGQSCINRQVFQYIFDNPSKVLLIFEGFDEFRDGSKVQEADTYPDGVKEKIPPFLLYKRLASGELLRGATILTTSRPTAVSDPKLKPILKVNKTVELLGFTSKGVEQCVKALTKAEHSSVGKEVWLHISSNLNILSLCYIPVTCFIVCSCLSQVFKFKFKRQSSSDNGDLPTSFTEIYQRATKLFLLMHHGKIRRRSGNNEREAEDKPEDDLLKENFSPEMEEELKPVTKIAFDGIEERTFIFEKGELKKAATFESDLFHRLPDKQTGAFTYVSQYCFLHLTLQEFLAAKYIVDTMGNDYEQLKSFISSCTWNLGTWEVVLQFIAGLLCKRDKSTINIFIDLLPQSADKTFKIEMTMRSKYSYEPKYLEEKTVKLSKCIFEYRELDSVIVRSKPSGYGFPAVNFDSCNLSPIDCSAIVNLLRNYVACYPSYSFSNNGIGDLGCVEIGKLFDVDSNQEVAYLGINLEKNEIADKGAEYLSEALSNSNCKLNNLNLSYNKITDEGVKHLSNALSNGNGKLNILNLSFNKIADEGVKYFSEALTHSNCKLSTIDLSGNSKITNKGVKHLSEVLANSSCKLGDLILHVNTITDEGAKHLSKALADSNCRLNTLGLSSTEITDEGVRHLSEALSNSNCKLSGLVIISPKLTDEGVKHLSEALSSGNCKLGALNICSRQITNKGATHLSKALSKSNCELKILDLDWTQIDDEGAADLLKAASHYCEINLSW